MLVAGIDIGTNTLRLLIAEFSPDGTYRKVKSERHITRLGEGISSTGRLKETAMERTLSVLKRFSKVCSENPLNGIYAVATSAVREASNGDEFVKRVKAEAGLDIDVISGDTEARLTMLGISSGLDLKERDYLLMDIGGGSTEFIFISEGDIISKVSTDIGVVRFTEQYIKSDPPGIEDIEKLEAAIDDRLDALPGFEDLCSNRDTALVGTAGTVTTLAAVEQKMTVYDPRKINGYKISREGIEAIRNELLPMASKMRKAVPGIEEGREDLIATGVVLVDKVIKRFGFSEVIVSDNGLREGLIVDLYNRVSGNSTI
ncbi:MAG: Ppx/GppA phosphatase family protein [Nitrospira sp.]|nr:Ppx/GppA phosphatase family protein [Nitrospira sp.]